ncbi:MAG: hypothetical protein IJM50_04365 [Lachnospiraceae bacterium]|nr:hypothetical protein [Lachnospiraceae bacterium]
MGMLINEITGWLKGMLIDGIMNNLSGMFDSVNRQVLNAASQIGSTPESFSPGVFGMVRNISESVILPIAGMFLTFVACYELIQLIVEHNNMASFETWVFFKWIFKTFAAVMLISNTFSIVMAVFDVSQHVVNSSAGLITGSLEIDDSVLSSIREGLEGMETGDLLGLFLQSFIVQICSVILSVLIFVIVYGRMMEIYLMTSLAPIPFSTFGNREQSHIGQNYLRSLLALGFQGFLIMVCIAIYSVLLRTAVISDDIIGSIWGVMGYTVLLCFSLFKTGSLAKSVMSAH